MAVQLSRTARFCCDASGMLRNVFTNVPLRSPDLPRDAPTPSIHIKDLALLAEMDEDRLLRILRLLEVNRMFKEVQEKTFIHTPLSAGLATENARARLGGALHYLFQACASLADSIEGGSSSAWVERFGMPIFKHLEQRDNKDRVMFAKSMAERSQPEMKQILRIFPWESVRSVVDIGGGAGHLAACLGQVRLAFFSYSPIVLIP